MMKNIQKVVIELMNFDDIKNVIEVENKSFTIPWHEESFIQELSNNLALYLVAKIEGRAVG